MKSAKHIYVVLIILSAWTSLSFAAEKESWIQKLRNRFFGRKEAAVAKEQPVQAPLGLPAALHAPERTGAAGSRETAGAPTPAQPVKAKRASDMSTDELVREIADALEDDPEIMNYIPYLKKSKDPEGKEFYMYMETRLERLDRERLEKIFTRVRQERTRLRTERITRQLESIRQAQQAAAIAQQASRIPRIVTPPPQPPRIPSTPTNTQVPKPPQAPPAVPSTRR